jgi:hypothetical protein
MNDIISEEWERFKKEIHLAIKETIERNNVEKETLYIMLNMLERSKLKPKGE